MSAYPGDSLLHSEPFQLLKANGKKTVVNFIETMFQVFNFNFKVTLIPVITFADVLCTSRPYINWENHYVQGCVFLHNSNAVFLYPAKNAKS